jgi:phosphatidylserine/phosphatidylglycerophosphate/cardiolipin synthase-like enzyme
MPAPHDLDPWPEQLTPMIEQVDVAIARTQPELQGIQPEIREIEALYLEAIDRAQRTIYLESQYLASRKIAEALALRLAAADGPEVLIVLPQTTEGWLESKTMGGARQRLVHLLRRADVHKRLGVFYPVTRAGQPIYVHAKIMMIDDELLRVGSSNLNNRSMGFDTECDLALEVASTRSNAEQLRSAISQLRRDLLCEHLGIAPEQFAAAMDRLSGSVLKTINALRGPGRTLEALSSSEVAEEESILAENELLDPERPPPDLTQRISAGLSRILTRTGLRLTRP